MEYQNPLEPTVDTPPAKKGLSSFAIAGIGCAVVALLFIVTVGAAAWWVKGKVRLLAADVARDFRCRDFCSDSADARPVR